MTHKKKHSRRKKNPPFFRYIVRFSKPCKNYLDLRIIVVVPQPHGMNISTIRTPDSLLYLMKPCISPTSRSFVSSECLQFSFGRQQRIIRIVVPVQVLRCKYQYDLACAILSVQQSKILFDTMFCRRLHSLSNFVNFDDPTNRIESCSAHRQPEISEP